MCQVSCTFHHHCSIFINIVLGFDGDEDKNNFNSVALITVFCLPPPKPRKVLKKKVAKISFLDFLKSLDNNVEEKLHAYNNVTFVIEISYIDFHMFSNIYADSKSKRKHFKFSINLSINASIHKKIYFFLSTLQLAR